MNIGAGEEHFEATEIAMKQYICQYITRLLPGLVEKAFPMSMEL